MEKSVCLCFGYRSRVVLLTAVVWALLLGVEGHGRLWDPPSRSSMWRRGYNTTVNINDNELSCGGFTNHWISYAGRCGVCGDAYQQEPRDNEIGGKYYSGIITRTYPIGATIEVTVGLTANHGGFFEFKLCPILNPDVSESHECMDSHPLRIQTRDSDKYKYFIKDLKLEGELKVPVILPPKLECEHCVLQWKYRTGTRWGCDDDLSCGQGKGPQEEFYGCADIAIADVVNTIYNNPVISVHPDEGTVGLNHLGSNTTQFHTFSNKTIDIKPISTSSNDRSYSTTYPRANHNSLPFQSRTISQVTKKTTWHPMQTTYEGSFPSKTLPITEIPKKVLWQTDNSLWEPNTTIWKFLEDLTTEALIHYYQKGNNFTYGPCQPTSRFKGNPIFYEFCAKQCSDEKSHCPKSMCDCSAGPVDVSAQIPDKHNNDNLNKVINFTTFKKKYLKSFVRKLILSNRLLGRSLVQQNGKRSQHGDGWIPTASKLFTLVTPQATRTDIPYLQTMPADHSQQLSTDEELKLKPGIGGLVASEIQEKQDHKRILIQPRVLTCKASEEFSHNPFMARWCNRNCPFGFCPARVCSCTS